jgi:hypothetical protein
MKYKTRDGERIGIDLNGTEVRPGDPVEVKMTTGRYGQTRTIRGTFEKIDRYGGLTLTLKEGTQFSEEGRRGMRYYEGGDSYYTQAYSGRKCGSIPFHRHENYVVLLSSLEEELEEKPSVE